MVPLQQLPFIDATRCWYDPSYDPLAFPAGQSGSLYINLVNGLAISEPFLQIDAARTGNDSVAYLHLVQTKQFLSHESFMESVQARKTMTADQRAINPLKIVHVTTTISATLVSSGGIQELELDNPQLSADVKAAVAEVQPKIRTNRAAVTQLLAAEGDKLSIGDLPVPVPINNPAPWKCMDCGRTTNIWINLLDGYIGCGRRQVGMPNSGCEGDREGAAILHYNANPDKHVAVKLTTLSPQLIEAYSYSLDEFVDVSNVDEILKAYKIDRMGLVSVEQSLQDLAIAANQNLELKMFAAETEGLTRQFGMNRIGTVNVGNSCYMGSVMQLLAEIYRPLLEATPDRRVEALVANVKSHPEAAGSELSRFHLLVTNILISLLANDGSESIALDAAYRQARADFARLAGDSLEREILPHDDTGMTYAAPVPSALRREFSTIHPEFYSTRQQDAEEFFRICYDQLTRFEESSLPPWNVPILKESLMTQIEHKETLGGRVRVNIEDANVVTLQFPEIYHKQFDENVPPITFEDLLKHWRGGPEVDSSSRNGLHHFPRLILFQLQRMTYSVADQAAKKIVVPVPVTEEIMDLPSLLKSEPLQPGEEVGEDLATQQILTMLLEFGFLEGQIRAAIQANKSNLDVGVLCDWISSHPDAFAARAEASASGPSGPGLQCKYRLLGVVSHLGKDIHSGHYVAHVRRKEEWILLNDETAVSSTPANRFVGGYLYLFETL